MKPLHFKLLLFEKSAPLKMRVGIPSVISSPLLDYRWSRSPLRGGSNKARVFCSSKRLEVPFNVLGLIGDKQMSDSYLLVVRANQFRSGARFDPFCSSLEETLRI